MKRLIMMILLFILYEEVFSQDNILSNSFEGIFRNNINYNYDEKLQIHNYSGNWDIDGDGVLDSIMFIGSGGAHLYYSLFINLSKKNKDYYFSFLSIDYPFLETIDQLINSDSMDVFPKFVVHDFNHDGIADIFLNIDFRTEAQKKLQSLGVTSNRIILFYDDRTKKIIIKNYKNEGL